MVTVLICFTVSNVWVFLNQSLKCLCSLFRKNFERLLVLCRTFTLLIQSYFKQCHLYQLGKKPTIVKEKANSKKLLRRELMNLITNSSRTLTKSHHPIKINKYTIQPAYIQIRVFFSGGVPIPSFQGKMLLHISTLLYSAV